jgi:hypothetical protein
VPKAIGRPDPAGPARTPSCGPPGPAVGRKCRGTPSFSGSSSRERRRPCAPFSRSWPFPWEWPGGGPRPPLLRRHSCMGYPFRGLTPGRSRGTGRAWGPCSRPPPRRQRVPLHRPPPLDRGGQSRHRGRKLSGGTVVRPLFPWLTLSLVLLAVGGAWLGALRSGARSLPVPAPPPPSSTPQLLPAYRPPQPDPRFRWPAPAPLEPGSGWVYGVFTPPRLYLEPAPGGGPLRFRFVPPSGSARAEADEPATFGLRLVRAEPVPSRFQVVRLCARPRRGCSRQGPPARASRAGRPEARAGRRGGCLHCRGAHRRGRPPPPAVQPRDPHRRRPRPLLCGHGHGDARRAPRSRRGRRPRGRGAALPRRPHRPGRGPR